MALFNDVTELERLSVGSLTPAAVLASWVLVIDGPAS